jgi:hypothetical protein
VLFHIQILGPKFCTHFLFSLYMQFRS